MKHIVATIIFFFCLSISSFSQMTFTDLASYCRAMSETVTPLLLARTEGLPRTQAEELMKGMTDPVSIRMVKEAIEFAYSRQANIGLDTMRTELRNMCLAKRVFVQ